MLFPIFHGIIFTSQRLWHIRPARMLCSYLLLLCSCLFLVAVYLGTKGLVHSERELLEASVLHPLFNTEVG